MTVKVDNKNLKTLLAKYQTEFKGTNYKDRKKIVETFVNELLEDFLSDSPPDEEAEEGSLANEISYIPSDQANIYIDYNK